MSSRSTSPPIQVLIVDDHPLVRLGISVLLEQETTLAVCGQAADEKSALRIARETKPDVAIIDLLLCSSFGLDLIDRFSKTMPEIAIVVSSIRERDLDQTTVSRSGALVYVPKDCGVEELVQKIHEAARGRSNRPLLEPSNEPLGDTPLELFSKRELEVFHLIGEGLSTSKIATQLSRSVKTIESHKARIKKKLGIKSASELASEATRWVCS